MTQSSLSTGTKLLGFLKVGGGSVAHLHGRRQDTYECCLYTIKRFIAK